jgi:uncharacterized protein with GYD domain
MPTFISLITETQQGETQIKKSVERASQFQQEAANFGAKVTATYWTMGAFDGVLIFEAPDDEQAAALLHHLGSKGAVRTQTLRAFDAKSTQSILSTLARKTKSLNAK